MTEYDFQVIRGNTLPLEFRFKDGDGNSIDITGYNFEFRVVDSQENEILKLSTSDSPPDLDMGIPTEGIITGTIDAETTREFPSGPLLKWELEARYPNGWQITWALGLINSSGVIANDDT